MSAIVDTRDLVEKLIAESSRLRINVEKRDRVYVLDCGVNTRPGLLVGKMISTLSMAGLAEVEIHAPYEQSLPFPSVRVLTDNPVSACLCSQAATWVIRSGDYVCYVSGPGRVLANKPRSFLDKLRDFIDVVDKEPIFIVECLPVSMPPQDVIDKIANAVPDDRVYVLATSALSLAGAVQICSRVIEVALMRMLEFEDLSNIASAIGSCLVPPPRDDVYVSIAACNDCIRFTGQVCLIFNKYEGKYENLRKIVTEEFAPSFLDLVREHGPEFLTKAPMDMFTVAELIVFSGSSTRRSGRKHIDRILDYLKTIR